MLQNAVVCTRLVYHFIPKTSLRLITPVTHEKYFLLKMKIVETINGNNGVIIKVVFSCLFWLSLVASKEQG